MVLGSHSLQDDLPLSIAQDSIWAHEASAPGTAAYVIGSAFRLRRDITPERLEELLERLCETHEALRTHVVAASNPPTQRLLERVVATLRRTAVASLDGAACEALIQLEFATPINIHAAPMARFTYVADSDGRGLLIVALHHLVADFRSLDIIVGDLQRLVAAANLPPAWPMRALLAKQTNWLASPDGQTALQACRANVATLLRTRERGPRRTALDSRLAGVETAEPLEVETATLRGLARSLGATPFALVLAAFALDEAGPAGPNSVVLGITVDQRDSPASRRTMGYLVNTLPVAIDLPRDASFAAIVHAVHQQLVALMRWRHLPLPLVLDGLKLAHGPDAQPLFSALVHWLAFAPGFGGDSDPVFAGLQPSYGLRQRAATHDVVLTIEDRGRALHGVFTLRTDVYEPGEGALRLRRLSALLQQVLAEPQAEVAAIQDHLESHLSLFERLEF